MIFKNLCIIALRTKVASALEGLNYLIISGYLCPIYMGTEQEFFCSQDMKLAADVQKYTEK